MSTGRISCSVDNGVATIVIDNPQRRNAIDGEMWKALRDTARKLDGDDAVKVIMLSGAGSKVFASGADITSFGEGSKGYLSFHEVVNEAHVAIATMRKPTVAAIQGYCLGGGLALAIACDIRLASTNALFSSPGAKLGLGYGYDWTRRMVNEIGPSVTRDLLFSGRMIGAEEAYALGIVNLIYSEQDFPARSKEYVRKIAENAPLNIAATKAVVADLFGSPAQSDREACERQILACLDSEDFAEGKRAFREKRKPVFIGR